MTRAQKSLTMACLLAGLWITTGLVVRADDAGRAARLTLPRSEGPTQLPLKPAYLNRVVEDSSPILVEPLPAAATVDDAGGPALATVATSAESDEAKGGEAKTGKADATEESAATPAVEKPKRQLAPALAALRDQVRQTLTQQRKQPFNTRDNLPTEILDYCLAFGCDTDVSLEGVGGRKLNGITCLCWNYSCASFELLKAGQGRIFARIGYGGQEQPGALIAMLAISRVPPTYPIRAGNEKQTVADLAETEKLSCRAGSDMSLKLIGLAYYVESPNWKNDLGEEWSVDRIVQQEIAQPIVSAPDGGLNRLLGLSFVVQHRLKHDLPIEGQAQRAQRYVSDFQNFALSVQNSDGTWGPSLLAARSTSSDAGVVLWATGRILEWLAMSLPEDRLEDPRVIRAVEQVTRLLSTQRYQRNAPYLSTREISALGHALHALALYDERVFKPTDVEEKPAAEKGAPAKSAPAKSAVEKPKPAAERANSTAKLR